MNTLQSTLCPVISDNTPSTPQRKLAIVNQAFEEDEEGSGANKCPPGNSSVLVPLKKIGPQKIQSTPNVFSKELQEKKIIDRSISVPHFYKKKSKEERKIK